MKNHMYATILGRKKYRNSGVSARNGIHNRTYDKCRKKREVYQDADNGWTIYTQDGTLSKYSGNILLQLQKMVLKY